MSNCLFEATLQEVEKLCNCSPKYYVEISGYNACEGKSKKCMNQLMVEMGDKRDVVDGDEIKALKKLKLLRMFCCNLNVIIIQQRSIFYKK
jgi:hypothetical protein